MKFRSEYQLSTFLFRAAAGNQPMSEDKSEFEQASEENRQSIAAEFWEFLKYNKKWWLTPIVLVLLLLVVLLSLAGPGSAFAPFVYTLF